MPEELNQDDQGQDAGDNAAAQAAATAAGDSSDKKDEGTGDGEEMITVKRKEHEDYKSRAIGKAAERPLTPTVDDKNKDGAGDGAAAATAIDEKKITEAATAAATKTLRDASERAAKRAFLQAHSEYVADDQWQNLLSHLTFKGGEITEGEIRDRMEAAVLEHKRSTGKLDEYLKSEHERGVREGRIQADVATSQSMGGAGDRAEGGKGKTLSAKGEEMARGMHVDPAKAAAVDPSRDSVIPNDKI